MKITVSEKDIQQGVRRHCNLCPVARAVARALRDNGVEFDNVRVGPMGIGNYSRGQHWVDFGLPPAADLFITRFDASGPVEPFEFELNIDCSWTAPG